MFSMFTYVFVHAADVEVQREAQTASNPFGGDGLRGWGRDITCRAGLSKQGEGGVSEGGGAHSSQQPRRANQPTTRTHTQPGGETYHTYKRHANTLG